MTTTRRCLRRFRREQRPHRIHPTIEILRALPRVGRGIAYVYEEFRDDLDFSIEKLVERIDPREFFSRIGAVRLHHCCYKCTVWFTEYMESSFPLPFRCKRRRVEVVYLDKDYLELVTEATGKE